MLYCIYWRTSEKLTTKTIERETLSFYTARSGTTKIPCTAAARAAAYNKLAQINYLQISDAACGGGGGGRRWWRGWLPRKYETAVAAAPGRDTSPAAR